MATSPDPTNAPLTPQPSAAATSAGMKAALEDRSQYIRTMAKDMAALAGTPVASRASAPVRAPEKERETVDGVTTEKTEQPFFERPQSRAEREGEETVELPSFKEASAIVGRTPAGTAPEAGPEKRPMMPQEAVVTERASILERLRQRVGESAQMDLKAPAPAPSGGTSDPVPARKEWPRAASLPIMPATAPANDVSHRTPMIASSALPSVRENPASSVQAPALPRVERVEIPSPAPSPVPAPEIPASVPSPEPVTPAPAPSKPAASYAPPSMAWGNIPTPAPSFAPFAEPQPPRMPPVQRESYREPIEPYAPPRPQASPGAFHSYTTDFADRIDTKGSSAFSVLAAEQDARPQERVVLATRKESPLKAILAIGSGALLLVLAGAGIFATYQFVTTMKNTPVAALTVPSIVFADEYRKLEGSGTVLMNGLLASANGTLLAGNVLVTYIILPATDEGGGLVSAPPSGNAFLRALQVPAPDILLRNVADESTVGVINAGGATHAFFALRVDSYERTYAGMLTWEPLMQRDLGLLYPLYPAPQPLQAPETGTSTASSTLTATSTSEAQVSPDPSPARTRFEDAVVANHDVRILRDAAGKSLILYGYADKRTLLIVRDEAAFEALLSRLKNDQ